MERMPKIHWSNKMDREEYFPLFSLETLLIFFAKVLNDEQFYL